MYLKGKCLSDIWPRESLSHGQGITGKQVFFSPVSLNFFWLVLFWVEKAPFILQEYVSSKDLLFLEMSGQKLDSHLERKL